MSESAVERERRGRRQDSDAQQRHIAALQAEKERVRALSSVSMRERMSKWGPSLADLMIAIDAAILASDPQRGVPIGDTMRVSVPSSEGDEGAATRKMRAKANDYRREVASLAARMASTFGQELPDRRDFSAHVRHHADKGRTSVACQWCEGEKAS